MILTIGHLMAFRHSSNKKNNHRIANQYFSHSIATLAILLSLVALAPPACAGSAEAAALISEVKLLRSEAALAWEEGDKSAACRIATQAVRKAEESYKEYASEMTSSWHAGSEVARRKYCGT
jgi:hypothetical protein